MSLDHCYCELWSREPFFCNKHQLLQRLLVGQNTEGTHVYCCDMRKDKVNMAVDLRNAFALNFLWILAKWKRLCLPFDFVPESAEPDKGQKREVQLSGRGNLTSTVDGAHEPATRSIQPYMNPSAPVHWPLSIEHKQVSLLAYVSVNIWFQFPPNSLAGQGSVLH